MDTIIIISIFLTVGYFAGNAIEKKHFRRLKAQEYVYMDLPVVTTEKFVDQDKEVKSARLVHGSVVISSDYFKDFVARLKSMLGGRLDTYESLMDRARREALLRMKKQAPDADIIINARIETSEIGSKSGVSVEVIAYGTAIKYVK